MTRIRKEILEKRLAELQGIRADLSPMQVEKVGDFGDQAQKLTEQVVTAEISRSRKNEIDRIKLALQGDSDQCQDCGDDIGAMRLNARPESTLCLRCQATMEGVGLAEPKRLKSYQPRVATEHNRSLDYQKRYQGTRGKKGRGQ